LPRTVLQGGQCTSVDIRAHFHLSFDHRGIVRPRGWINTLEVIAMVSDLNVLEVLRESGKTALVDLAMLFTHVPENPVEGMAK